MKAITIVPGVKDSVSLRDVPEPPQSEGSILVRALELGICGTDFELISAEYGFAAPGYDYLILGHESLGVVEDAPQGSGFQAGDLVVGIVRHPDPVPCIACGAGEWDMCLNGRYTERGIKERNGFGSERWRTKPEYTVRLDSSLRDVGVLMEPATILAKAWDHVTRVGLRAIWQPKTLLVTGAGTIGLLAALFGRQRGLDVHVIDRMEEGLKPDLVRSLGASYHTGPLADLGFKPDITLECTGVSSLVADAMNNLAKNGVLCLLGVSSPHQMETMDLGTVNRDMVLENRVVLGIVNANRAHYQQAEQALLKADRKWLSRLISRHVNVENFQQALQRQPDDIKVVIDFALQ